jgi:predicted RNase H-like nuclease (RuvC/YqgF family)
MTAEEIVRFQKLHGQSVRGKPLSEADQIFYEANMVRLEGEESAQFRSYEATLVSRIHTLEDTLSHLQERRAALKARLESLEPARAA